VYRSRDHTASTRMYAAQRPTSNKKRRGRTQQKVWHGGYFYPFVCDYLRAPVAFHFFEARINEASAYPESYEQLHRMLGRDPVSVTLDKGPLTKAVFEHNTRRGVATIGPDRKPNRGMTIADIETHEYDRFGPRCKHCGGPVRVFGHGAGGTGLGFRISGTGDPRIHFRCQDPLTPNCKRVQSMSCSREWRLLLPIPRHSDVYQTLLAAHKNREGVFDAWRDRYGVAGNSHASRPKRLQSMPCQRLRAAAALILEWFRICLRQGWISAHVKRNPNQPKPHRHPEIELRRIAAERRRLALPYGPAAEAIGINRSGPPPPGAPLEPLPPPPDDDALPF
jgi:hypothetical protein